VALTGNRRYRRAEPCRPKRGLCCQGTEGFPRRCAQERNDVVGCRQSHGPGHCRPCGLLLRRHGDCGFATQIATGPNVRMACLCAFGRFGPRTREHFPAAPDMDWNFYAITACRLATFDNGHSGKPNVTNHRDTGSRHLQSGRVFPLQSTFLLSEALRREFETAKLYLNVAAGRAAIGGAVLQYSCRQTGRQSLRVRTAFLASICGSSPQ
jgi:hypothetical protein